MNPDPNHSESLIWFAIMLAIVTGHIFIALFMILIVLETA
jgi:hypothetical protein